MMYYVIIVVLLNIACITLITAPLNYFFCVCEIITDFFLVSSVNRELLQLFSLILALTLFQNTLSVDYFE